jgi:hypothetical protein
VKFVAAFGEVLLGIVVAVLAGMLLYRLWRAPGSASLIPNTNCRGGSSDRRLAM